MSDTTFTYANNSDKIVEWHISRNRDLKFIHRVGDREVELTHIDPETCTRMSVKLKLLRLKSLIHHSCGENFFMKHDTHVMTNSKETGILSARHLGGGYFLSLCDPRGGVRIGEFYQKEDLLFPFGEDVRIYEEEWNDFLSVLHRMANSNYLLLPERYIDYCPSTPEHIFWMKLLNKCSECEPYDLNISTMEFKAYK
jgi:hypothetical protein